MCFSIAKQSECEVTGVTLSKNQYNYCVQKAKELKLDNQCHFELLDYRYLKGKFHRIVSVGMLEHVGRKFYKTFFKKINDLMTDDGLSLIHTIGSTDSKAPPQPFIQKYIFPGGLVPSGSDLIGAIEKTDLILSDMESLIHHYDKTLKAWLERVLQTREKAKELKLDNQCHFELSDYREIKGKFNRIVSVGMLEHVGRKFYKTFFKKINKLLTDDGLALIHTIGSTEPKGPPQPFIQKYIFPGGLVPSGSDLIDAIEKTGLVLSDMESLIHHYDKTLKAWLDRFLENREKVKKMYSESFCKMWEFYLAGCSAAFHHRDLLVYQLQIVKNFSTIPSNRRDYIYN